MPKVTRPKVYHRPDLQVILGLGRDTVLRLLKNGDIRSIKAGPRSKYLIPSEALDDFLAGRSNGDSDGWHE